MPEIRTASCPPPPGPRDKVVRVLAGERVEVISCSTALWQVWTHWMNERTSPCVNPKSDCRGCLKGAPTRYKAYLHVYMPTETRDVFLELTPDSANQLLIKTPENQPLRGVHFKIERGRGQKAHLTVTVYPRSFDSEKLPAARDPRPVLEALWAMPSRQQRFLDRQATFDRRIEE